MRGTQHIYLPVLFVCFGLLGSTFSSNALPRVFPTARPEMRDRAALPHRPHPPVGDGELCRLCGPHTPVTQHGPIRAPFSLRPATSPVVAVLEYCPALEDNRDDKMCLAERFRRGSFLEKIKINNKMGSSSHGKTVTRYRFQRLQISAAGDQGHHDVPHAAAVTPELLCNAATTTKEQQGVFGGALPPWQHFRGKPNGEWDRHPMGRRRRWNSLH